ncbi:MAG: hypothetical protein ACOY99_07605 [Pseudomonadota bacterium]
MLRWIWVIVSLALAGLTAALLAPLAMALAAQALAAGPERGAWFAELVSGTGLLAMETALFFIAAVVFGPLPLAVADSLRLRNISRQFEALQARHKELAHSPDLLLKAVADNAAYRAAAQAYAATFQALPAGEDAKENGATFTPCPAERFFAAPKLQQKSLMPGLYWALALGVLLTGLALFLKNWLFPVPSPLLGALQKGTLAFSLCAASAVFGVFIVEALASARQGQALRFAARLDAVYQKTPMPLMLGLLCDIAASVRALDVAASPPLAMARAVEAAAEDLRQAVKDNVKTGQGLAKSHGDFVKNGLEPMVKRLDALGHQLEDVLSQLLPSLTGVQTQQEAVLKALQDDDTAAKAMARAVEDMAAAARASRETVERFITLAERMRETSRALQASLADDGALAAPVTARRLSSALQDLKKTMENTELPEI